MITTKNLIKQYSKIDSIKYENLCLPSTGVVLLTGENGTGKTTLLDIISLNDLDFKGEFFFGNLNVKKLSNRTIQDLKKNHISYIKQKNNLIDFLSREEDENLFDVYTKSKIEHTRTDSRNCSEGEQMMMVLSSYLKSGKQLYILDEVFASLSERNQEKIIGTLKELKKEALVIIVSHGVDLEEITDLTIYLSKNSLSSTQKAENKNTQEPYLNTTGNVVYNSRNLFKLYFLKRFKLLFSFFIISFLFLSFLNVGTPFITLTPDLACTNEVRNLNSFVLDSDRINSDIILKKFRDSIYFVAHGVTIRAANPSSNMSSYPLYGNFYYTNEIKDDYIHVSENFFDYLVNKCGYAESDLSTVSYYYINQNYKKETQIVKDSSFKNSGFFINENYFDFAYNQVNTNLLFFKDAYWNTDDYNAEYYNNNYRGYYLITKSYAREILGFNVEENLSDDTIYINDPSLFVKGELTFSRPPLLDNDLTFSSDYNEILKNISLQLIKYPKIEEANYFLVSDNLFNKLCDSKRTSNSFAIFLNDKNRNSFFNEANRNYVDFSFNYERSDYSFSFGSKEYEEIEKRIRSRTIIIKNKYLSSNVQWVTTLCYLLSISYFLYIVSFIYQITVIGKNNLNLLKKDGFYSFQRFLVIYGPYLLMTFLAMPIAKLISLSLGNMSNSLNFTYYFIPLNILFYILFFVIQIVVSYIFMKAIKFRN